MVVVGSIETSLRSSISKLGVSSITVDPSSTTTLEVLSTSITGITSVIATFDVVSSAGVDSSSEGVDSSSDGVLSTSSLILSTTFDTISSFSSLFSCTLLILESSSLIILLISSWSIMFLTLSSFCNSFLTMVSNLFIYLVLIGFLISSSSSVASPSFSKSPKYSFKICLTGNCFLIVSQIQSLIIFSQVLMLF